MGEGEQETDVVWSLKKHLIADGLAGREVQTILVDAHPSNLGSRHRAALEPMAHVSIDGAIPDILCTLTEGETPLVAGIEVKPRPSQWVKGLGQARRYRTGVHLSYFAAPGPLSDETLSTASEFGVGVLGRSGQGRWQLLLDAPVPRPSPWTLAETEAALRGVPTARRLQLNHPLNYLIVAWLAHQYPGAALLESLEREWPSLGTAGTRRHAVEGAVALGLIDWGGAATVDGLVAAELMSAVGFQPDQPVNKNKRSRLCEAAPAIAAVGRAVFLRHPAVRLVVETLLGVARPVNTIEFLHLARDRSPVLADALLLQDARYDAGRALHGRDFNPSGVHKFRQNLWHLGLVATKKHRSAGGPAEEYQAEQDLWAVDERFVREG
jgi:hypothetical protein